MERAQYTSLEVHLVNWCLQHCVPQLYDYHSPLLCNNLNRRNVRQAIVDGGQDVWQIILTKEADIVLPLLVIMAESKDVEETKLLTDGKGLI